VVAYYFNKKLRDDKLTGEGLPLGNHALVNYMGETQKPVEMRNPSPIS
jgi:hypothetical protein|tara:strand:- start:243 stop:386 length:144 start_codon:yes stop_codon:yes gene_type:complete